MHRVQGNVILPTSLNLATEHVSEGRGPRNGKSLVKSSQFSRKQKLKVQNMALQDVEKVCISQKA